MRTGRPLVTVKAAVTLDGKIGAPDDNQGWITSEPARAHVQTLRHRSDAILTGIGTVLADDCRLTDRTGEERSRPLLRIVLDSLLRIPAESKMVTSARNDVLVVTTSAASSDRRRRLESKGVRVEVLEGSDGRVDLRRRRHPAGARKISLADDRSRQPHQLDRAGIRHRRQNLLLLRAQDPRRHPIVYR